MGDRHFLRRMLCPFDRQVNSCGGDRAGILRWLGRHFPISSAAARWELLKAASYPYREGDPPF